MGFYESRILPKLLNCCMSMGVIAEERARLVPRAHGKVLEIGIGSGLNLPHYGPGVESVTGVDPSVELGEMAARQASLVAFPVHFEQISGESLPFGDASFDCAVITWTLCTIPDPSAALREVRRVLKPGAELFFVEHGHAPDPGVVVWQNRLNKVWPAIAGGCNLNRKMDQIITAAGFRIDELEASYRPGLRPMTYFYMGVARPA
ncbi:class I SAM-dependent methyltransferase [Emcibacter sp. SYSU 3D8]|uniref:class I SAM-dependent methyltransferase n=1 Tax=Emcibacter sp. SYSU 3D8 TaxID=3133969 RepID=UPI0031FF145B